MLAPTLIDNDESDPIIECRYGSNCFRKNPSHFQQFSHPSDHPQSMNTSTGSGQLATKRKNVDVDDESDTKRACISSSSPTSLSGFYLTSVNGISPMHNTNAIAFADILSSFKPLRSIHFNFMIEIDWLLRQYPSTHRTNPITLVVGETSGTDYSYMRRQCASHSHLNIARARLPIPYGSHHTKLSIIESERGLHIIVSTANLIERDWYQKTQAVYIFTATSKKSGDAQCQFQDDLVRYLDAYGKSPEINLIKPWQDACRQYDFSSIPKKVRLVASIPGYHRAAEKNSYGHLALRSLTRQIDVMDKTSPIVCQFSSIGSLGASPDKWLTNQFFQSLAPMQTNRAIDRLKLIYPTVDNVRESLEGYAAGGSLPYHQSNHIKQQYLRQYLHRWSSEANGRNRAIPHMKFYARIGVDNRPEWMLVTSANLSKAAWGELQKNDEQLAIRSYELGVFIGDVDAMPSTLPFDWPPKRYDTGDRPWVTDQKYELPDLYGHRWPLD